MLLSLDILKQKGACSGGIELYKKIGCPDTVESAVKLAFESDDKKKYQHCNWIFRKTFTKNQSVRHAIFAAKLVIDIYDKKYPEDKRPLNAIEAAENYLKTVNKPAYAAYAAAAAAYADAACAYDAAARKETQQKIINYGIELLASDAQK